MRTLTARLPVLVIAAVGISTGVGACGGPETGEALVVQQNNRVLSRFSLQQLQGLPQVEITTPQSHGAQVQKGPTVRSVLDAAHATGVTSVRVEGRDPAQTFGAAELTKDVILDITKRNTLKLTGTNLRLDRWVRDVTALVVNP